jgi:hypothetical protein
MDHLTRNRFDVESLTWPNYIAYGGEKSKMQLFKFDNLAEDSKLLQQLVRH